MQTEDLRLKFLDSMLKFETEGSWLMTAGLSWRLEVKA